MKVVISAILYCLTFHPSYSQERFWELKIGASLDSTRRSVYQGHGLTSYERNRKLAYRDGIIGGMKAESITLLFNQSDQLYNAAFVFRPKTYLDMVRDYRYLKWFIELTRGLADITVDEFPGGKDNKVNSDGEERMPDNYEAYSIWCYPKQGKEGTKTALILRMDFKYYSPVITIDYKDNKTLNNKPLK